VRDIIEMGCCLQIVPLVHIDLKLMREVWV